MTDPGPWQVIRTTALLPVSATRQPGGYEAELIDRYRAARAERMAAIAAHWPLITTYDLGHRASPRGLVSCWSVHVRCAWRGGCHQSVMSQTNDSGSYVWSAGDHLLPALSAHILQCHRAESGYDEGGNDGEHP
jgi:hypothetical protein